MISKFLKAKERPSGEDIEIPLEDLIVNGISQSLASVLDVGNDADGQIIQNLGTPVSADDAATKQYVDDQGDLTPLGFGTYGGENVSISGGDSDDLTLTTKLSGDTLLDLSDAVRPHPLVAGVYAISVCVIGIDLDPGGTFDVFLQVSGAALGFAQVSSGPATGAQTFATVGFTTTLPASIVGGIQVGVFNRDSESDREFLLDQLNIQRLV